MHLFELLHKTFKDKLPQVHKTRLKSLMTICKATISGNKLYLTALGRAISNENKECSNIQKVDRLLGNGVLLRERDDFYKVMLSTLIQEQTIPWIHIDWTCINPVTNLYALRASASMPGRTIVIYEKCYPKKQENNPVTHKEFLNKLKSLLPKSVKPVIVTDAGFRAEWFAYILQLGWDFVGRLRNRNAVWIGDTHDWCLSSSYFEQATSKPTYLGQGLLTKKMQVPGHFVLYKQKPKNRKTLTINKKGKRKGGMNPRHSAASNEPWILFTSLSKASVQPDCITNIYRQRMRIEENFRDTKCPHYGFGLKDSLTKCPQRMDILLLIGAIATFGAWLAGLHTKSIGNATDFQAHSAKYRTSLSLVYLGKRALNKTIQLTQKTFDKLLLLLYQCALSAQQEIHHYG
jgi:hypothetical protein